MRGTHLPTMGGNNFIAPTGSTQMPQNSRKFIDLAQQQHGSRDEGYNRSQGMDSKIPNLSHQAYLQYAFQASQQKLNQGMHPQQQMNPGLVLPPSGKEQEMWMGNLKMQELFALQAATQAQASLSKKGIEHFTLSEKHLDQGQSSSDQRNDSKPQVIPPNVMRVGQTPQAHVGIQNIANNHTALAAQLQVWAQERNIDLTSPANMNLISQLVPAMQSRLPPQQKYDNIVNSQLPVFTGSRQQVASSPVTNESSPRGNTSSDISGHSGSVNALPFSVNHLPTLVNSNKNIQMQQFSLSGRDGQNNQRQSVVLGNSSSGQTPQSSIPVCQMMDQNFAMRNRASSSDSQQMQYLKQLNRPTFQAAASPGDGIMTNAVSLQPGNMGQMPQHNFGFTKHQLHVLKAQILAFRRLKKGDGSLPEELLQSIAPPPLLLQLQQTYLPLEIMHDRSAARNVENYEKQSDSTGKDMNLSSSTKTRVFPKDEEAKVSVKMTGTSSLSKGLLQDEYTGTEEKLVTTPMNKPEFDDDDGNHKACVGDDSEGGRTAASEYPSTDAAQSKKTSPPNNVSSQDSISSKKYHGPLFDFPFFTRRIDSLTPMTTTNNNNNLTLAYDVKDLLFEEGVEVIQKKRSENMNRIGNLLSVNLERKRIRPDLVLRLQIEEKKLRLLDVQARLREEIDQQQQEIMAMPDRPYRKFVRLCERQRTELARQVQATQKATREKQLKYIFQWRKKLLEAHWAIRDARIARNRGVGKYHERMLREFSKRKDGDRNKRMEALKNNDVERYRQMLMEQQTNIAGDGGERYAILSSFLTQTEEYLHKLGSKITAAKNQQEMQEAASTAAAAAWAQGLSEEEVKAAAACAGEEVMIRNRFSEMNAPRDSISVNKYYNLAHAVNERVTRQPSMLRLGTLRDYQLVGLQWMLSLYNNKLNGILADEMGLGKTVQVMALIAYLMEFKGNYGPHLIIVPNAVLVNWKSEFLNWLPSASCLFYVGSKDQRSKLFSQGVCSLKFNVLVTTYEFIMYDRSKLSKIDWKYIIIDEAQRMKDRESVLARDLDKYRCQRRLLLTGTPLQNDLKELWSLLNLLLPEVFDNRKAFHDWFSQPFQKEGSSHNGEDDWLETEKKVIVIHRLHQILEPFMLRRRVEDVEGTLPPKVSIVLRCKMSAMQSSIYDWIKVTGTLRVDPEDENHRVQKNPLYQIKVYRTLNNRCMELRKTCNHPLLNYPYYSDLSKEFLVKSCGKLWILDRVLMKLHRTGHRVLLFSTMTKLLDILEEYLQWRRLVYRRIDGTTSLEDRETAIVDFNSAGSDCFIFLLSIRAAGRGLNLQSADTVVIYDPDPNPKNEEQAVARAHRIGQTREVKVIYMEAVVDNIPSHQKEDEFRSGGGIDMEDELAGRDRYVGSIEGLIRNNIQQYKIDMADEVINAGRFDQRTTHEERRLTLETLLHDEERYQETVHDVPSLEEVNRMIARSKEEVDLFDQMDEELDWIEEVTKYEQVPSWLRADSKEVNATVAKLSKKPLRNRIHYNNMVSETADIKSELSPKTERKRGRPKGKAAPNYAELDDYNVDASDSSSVERNRYSVGGGEAADIGEDEDEETSGAAGVIPNKDRSEEDTPPCDDGEYRCCHASDSIRDNHVADEPGSSGSSSYNRQLVQIMSPVSSQKFGSLSALDSRPVSFLKRMPDELEEGEIAAISGESNFDHQQSGSWIHERDDGEDEQVLQPKIKRKRSVRVRPRPNLERVESAKYSQDKSFLKIDHKYGSRLRSDDPSTSAEFRTHGNEQKESSVKRRHHFPSRSNGNSLKLQNSPKRSRSNCISSPSEDAIEPSREIWDDKVLSTSGCSNFGMKMPDPIKRKCKMVMGKLQRRIEKGQQIIPLLGGLWKRSQNPGYFSLTGNSSLDLRKIEQRIDRSEHNGLNDFVLDVQNVLRSSLEFIGFSNEARTEARKVHDLFFDILKAGFPDTDFRELKARLSFTTFQPSPRRGPAPGSNPKRIKLINEVEQEPNPSGCNPTEDGSTRRGHAGLPLLLTQPGDLVVCKKRRKEREKSSAAKLRSISLGPGCVGSAPSTGNITKDTKWTGTHGWRGGGPTQRTHVSGGTSLGWANPVKRMRTDAGKRRPSHL